MVESGDSDVIDDTGPERYGPDEQYPSEEIATGDRALLAAIGDPGAGFQCLSVEEVREMATDVLTDLEVTEWSVELAMDIREDGRAVANSRSEGSRVVIDTGLRPEVMDVLDAFFDESLDQRLDAETAVNTLTERLEASGHDDFSSSWTR